MDAVRMAADDDAVIEGWAVPFDGHIAGGKDSYNTYFSARTNYALDWFPTDARPALYQHGLDPDTSITPVGRMRSIEVKETGGENDKGGVWMQAQLDKGNQYFEAIRDLVKAGKLYLSSGSVEHLVKIDQRSGEVLQWPIIEVSLTPTPANLLATIPVSNFRSALPDALPEGVTEDDTVTHAPKRDAVEPPAARDAEMGDDDDDVGTDERSFEDICGDLDRLLNPLYAPAYTERLDTFPTHVLVKRYEYGNTLSVGADPDDGCTYWDIPYTIGPDQEPVLGAPVQVEHNETFTPVARAADLPLGFDAQLVQRHVSAFAASTEGYGERRFREGRMLSASNLQTISDAADGLEAHAKKLRDLHRKASDRQDEAARAARFADPEWVRVQLKLLELATV